MSSDDCDQLGSRKMLIVMPFALAELPFAHRRLLGARVGRVEHVQHVPFEMGRRQAVGDQDDLPVRRVLLGQELPGHLQARAGCS